MPTLWRCCPSSSFTIYLRKKDRSKHLHWAFYLFNPEAEHYIFIQTQNIEIFNTYCSATKFWYLFIQYNFFNQPFVAGNISDPIFVQQQLLSGNVSKLAVETYKAALLKDVLDSPKIRLEAVKNIEASYGIALAGEAKRIKHCLSRYARENSQEMLLKISKHAFTFKVNNRLIA